MGLQSSENELVSKATSGQKDDDWQLILDICDKAKESRSKAKLYLEAIMARLVSSDDHVTMQAITLLDACVKNSGRHFHLEVASSAFVKQYLDLIKKRQGQVLENLLAVLKRWVDGDFNTGSEFKIIRDLLADVKKDGYDPKWSSEQKSGDKMKAKENEDTFQNDLQRAIELSKKEVSSPDMSTTNLYPSTSFSNTPEKKKVRAQFDFEAAEENELTLQIGDIIEIVDDSDPNWWSGRIGSKQGLFPSSFVTDNLLQETEPKAEGRKSVQFDDAAKVVKVFPKEVVEIDEEKMNKLLHLLHEADPTDTTGDPPEMTELAEEVYAMGPLIDAELERVDSRHAEITQLSMRLIQAMDLYRSLMDEPSDLHKSTGYPSFQPQVNGIGLPQVLPYGGMPPPTGPMPPPPHFMQDPSRIMNGLPPGPPGQFPMPGPSVGYGPAPMVPPPSLTGYPEQPPQPPQNH